MVHLLEGGRKGGREGRREGGQWVMILAGREIDRLSQLQQQQQQYQW